jgi:hypothetical protein
MTQRVRSVARLFGALAPLAIVALFVAWAQPTRAVVAGPDAPTLYLYYDSTFTRSSAVYLTFGADFDYPSSIVEYRTSNDPTTANGVLVNGTNLAGGGNWWTLAAGADGPRTIYGQTHHANGAWSPVGSLNLVLESDSAVRWIVDSDPLPNDHPETDWHDQFAGPEDVITAKENPFVLGPDQTFEVSTSAWGIAFFDAAGTISAGTHQIDAPSGDNACTSECVTVNAPFSYSCRAAGTFTIHDIEFTPEHDVARLDADYKLKCFDFYVVAGSIRYGSDRDAFAIDQSTDLLFLGEVNIGDPVSAGSITFTNRGTAADTLGTATMADLTGGDLTLTADDCSGATLEPNESCTVEVEYVATTIGHAGFKLTIADGTAKQGRRVPVGGYGYQPVTIALDVPSPPPFGPAPTLIKMTIYGGHDLGAALFIDGLGTYLGSGTWTTTNLSNPTRTEVTLTTTIGAGSHQLDAEFYGGSFYLPATADPYEFELGTATSLQLTTVTDDGVAVGETADLIAQLTSGGPVTGTLRIRDGIGGSIIATAAVSGDDPSLTKAVTKGLGSHAFQAEFVPGSPDIQASSDDYDLVVIDGTRPETSMDSSPLTTWYWQVQTEFDSPTPGATFECRMDFSNWIPCTSPALYSTGPPGTSTIKARAVAANGLADRTPATRQWTFDPNLTGSVTIAGSTQYTAATSVSVSTPAPAGTTATHVRLSNDGSSWTTRTYSATQWWTLTGGNGTKKVWTEWRDVLGHWSPASTDTIVLDTVDPTATAPGRAIIAGAPLSSDRVMVRVSWHGSDTRSGVARFDLERSKDGGSWGTRASTSSTTRDVALEGGHTYRYRVRAIDKAGNVGSWVAGSTFRVKRYSEASATYKGSWSPAHSSAFLGDAAKWSSTAGARLRFTVTGRSFGWLSDLGPARGRVAIYVNGDYKATVDLYAATPLGEVIAWSKTWSTSATRVVEIRVLSTPGRQRVDVDGFWVLT